MARTRSFSIYLLKNGTDATNALSEGHGLVQGVRANNLPEGATLYVLDNQPMPPWWRGYFGVQRPLEQVTKGALVFVTAGERCFALSFGHVSHHLKEDAYEYDFGLRVTLNSVDPNRLKSTDLLEPGPARRRRIQIPTASDLTLFDFDRDSNVLKSLTGKVREDRAHLFRQATGASNLRLSTNIAPNQLQNLCEELLALYLSDDFVNTFPGIQNVTPVRDPSLLQRLDQCLLEKVRANDNVELAVPDLINYNSDVMAAFSGEGPSDLYDDVFVGRYYEYLEKRERNIAGLELADLRRQYLVLTDADGAPRERYRIYKALVADVTLPEGEFHINEGNWYKVEPDFVKDLKAYLDPLWAPCTLPAYAHAAEGEYNDDISDGIDRLCLDKTNFSPKGQKALEPCDLYQYQSGKAQLIHVKISTLSNQLSHLFNQGANAIEFMKLDASRRERLRQIIIEVAGNKFVEAMVEPVNEGKWAVIFAVITKKDPHARSENFPLFSRISLRRAMKALHLMDVDRAYMFVPDETVPNAPKKKVRKKKGGH